MGKEVKTNAVRILDKNKISYELITYECDEFVDGLHTAELTGAPLEQSYKTLVMQGNSRQYYVFGVPIAAEVRRNDPCKGSYRNYRICPRRLQPTRNEKAVSDCH